jgi:hypothetical protein
MEEEGLRLEIRSTTASETWSFLQFAVIAPNVGAKLGRREKERWDE